MQTFDFPHHTPQIQYPESGTILSFGKSYEYASRPKAPDQIRFMLHFPYMKIYGNVNGAPDLAPNPKLNMGRLIQFYEQHRLHEKFIYPSVLKGNSVVRFAKPLDYKMSDLGGGVIEPFTLEFTLQP